MKDLIEPIGRIRSAHPDPDGTPVQTRLNWEEAGSIELDPSYAQALEGLAEFSHLWILTWLHSPGQPTGRSVPLRQMPFLLRPTGREIGVFAMRGPRRPNPIGLHLVRITDVTLTPPVIAFRGVDMVDGTPVLDIKPWVSRFDQPMDDNPRCGWFDALEIESVTPDDLARGRPRAG